MAALELFTQLVYFACVGVAVRLWWKARTEQAAWSAATFGVLGSVILISLFLGEGEQLPFPFHHVFIAVVLLLPWLLFRFGNSVVAAPPTLRKVVDVVGVGAALSTFAVSEFPAEGETPEGVAATWLLIIVVAWLLQAIVTTGLLWLASRGQPGVTRGRLRMLAVGTLLLGFAVTAGQGPGSEETQRLVSQLFSLSASITFLMGYAPPRLLRAAWRSRDEQALHHAAVELLAANSNEDVAGVLLPGLRSLLGSTGIAMLDDDGRAVRGDGEVVDPQHPDVDRWELGPLHLAHITSPSMPVFGIGEQDLVDRLALLATLATERVRLLESEQMARTRAEQAAKDLESANDELVSVNDELEAFVYTASHDLKNPIIALLGYMEVLMTDHRDQLDEDAQHYLERMTINAKFMQSLIHDLLELSRVGRIETDPAHVDLHGLWSVIRADVVDRHADLDVRVAWQEPVPALWANPTRARQLFENLVENACRYADRPDPNVTIDHCLDEQGLVIDIRDNGRGIPEAQLDRVFGMFERLDPDASTGTGMGLAICRRIVEDLDGTITALPCDDGAHFRIQLPPSAVAPDPGAPADGAAPTTTSQAPRPRINA